MPVLPTQYSGDDEELRGAERLKARGYGQRKPVTAPTAAPAQALPTEAPTQQAEKPMGEYSDAELAEMLGMTPQAAPQEEGGYWSGIGSQAMERGAAVAGGAATAVGAGLDEFEGALRRNLPEGMFSADADEDEWWEQLQVWGKEVQDESGERVAAIKADKTRGYTELEDVKQRFADGDLASGVGQALKFGFETGLVSIPELAAFFNPYTLAA